MEADHVYLEYLRSVNPIAQRIAEDLENIQNANQDKWKTLDEKSKMKLIDDNLIDSELILKYQDDAEEDSSLEPLSSFSWFTKSQLDLFTLVDVKPVTNRMPAKKFDLLSPVKKGKDTTDSKDLSIVNRIKLKVMKSPLQTNITTLSITRRLSLNQRCHLLLPRQNASHTMKLVISSQVLLVKMTFPKLGSTFWIIGNTKLNTKSTGLIEQF